MASKNEWGDDYSEVGQPSSGSVSVPGTTVTTSSDDWPGYSAVNTDEERKTAEKPKIPKKMIPEGSRDIVGTPDWLKKWLPDPNEDSVYTNPATAMKVLGEHVPILNNLIGKGDEDLARSHQDHPTATGIGGFSGAALPFALGGEALAGGMAAKGMTGFAPTMLSQGTMNAGADVADRGIKQAMGEKQSPSDYFWDILKGYGVGGIGAGFGQLASRGTGEAAQTAKTNAASYTAQGDKVKAARESLTGKIGTEPYPIGGIGSEVGGDMFGQGAKHIDELREQADRAGFNQHVLDGLLKMARSGEQHFSGVDPIEQSLLKLKNAQINTAQESADKIRQAYTDLATTSEKAPKVSHPSSPAERNSTVLEHLQASGITGGMGYLGSKLLGHADPITAAMMGAAVPAVGRGLGYASHAVGAPEKYLQLMQSKSGPAMMNAAIMAALSSANDKDK